jgi:hypothetical protein
MSYAVVICSDSYWAQQITAGGKFGILLRLILRRKEKGNAYKLPQS